MTYGKYHPRLVPPERHSSLRIKQSLSIPLSSFPILPRLLPPQQVFPQQAEEGLGRKNKMSVQLGGVLLVLEV